MQIENFLKEVLALYIDNNSFAGYFEEKKEGNQNVEIVFRLIYKNPKNLKN